MTTFFSVPTARRSCTIACSLLALTGCAAPSAPASTAPHAPLPGGRGLPQIEIGKVNILGIDELPPAMANEARDALGELQARELKNTPYYEPVDDDQWDWPDPVDTLSPNFRSMNLGCVLIRPRDLSHTELAGYRFLGLGDNTARPGEPVLTIARQFERPDGVRVKLVENEIEGQGAAVVVRELIRDRVGRWPAVFTVQRAPSGRVRTVLDWADDGTDFTLMVLDDLHQRTDASGYDKAWLIRLAQSIEQAGRINPRTIDARTIHPRRR